MIEFEFINIPFPPSVNGAYVYSRFSGRMVRSKDHRAFENQFLKWAFCHKAAIDKAAIELKGHKLSLCMHFHCATLTKSGATKKIDVSNRIKLLEDQVARALGIDDSNFWHVSAYKSDCPPEVARVDVKIRPLIQPLVFDV